MKNLFTIAPHAPFLSTLASNIIDGTILRDWDLSKPFALNDITILLPTQRARLALGEIFKQMLGGAAILPEIKTFGDEENEQAPFLPPYDAPSFAPAISTLRRNLILCSLVEKWMYQENRNIKPSASEVLNMANSLASLIDAINIEQISLSAIKNIAPENLSSYWQETLKFLDIALETWPKILQEENRIDASDLQNRVLLRQSKVLEQIYGDRPVIAAGSTGSILATSSLIKSISKLKRGSIVLAGLDRNLNEQDFKALLDKQNNPHSNHQYGLAQLLFRLGALPDSFDELAPKANNARGEIVRSSLSLAKNTNNWIEKRQEFDKNIKQAFAGVEIAQANNDEEQARIIALATNEALFFGKSVGIITPDRNLARRIIAELKRFDIEVDDSAGTPLFQTRAGRLIRQIIALCVSDFAPLNLIALLHNHSSNFSLNRATISRLSNLLEIAILRGSSLTTGLIGIKDKILENRAKKQKYAKHYLSEQEAKEINYMLDNISHALSALIELFSKDSFSVAQFAKALEKSLKGVIKSDENEKNLTFDIKQIFIWLEQLVNANDLGPSLNKYNIADAISGLMNNISVRANNNNRQDVAIWGLLEARLQNKDYTILAGLNENIWPQIADPGAWLSRNMAMSAGLEPPERRQGQAAHDFAMALGNENVLITYAKNIGTSPAIISRLLRRISAFIGEEQTKICLKRGEKWLRGAFLIDYVKDVRPALRPNPCPPKNQRPKSLSVTEIEKLIRSPYDIYAKYVLRLKPLEPLAQQPSGRERGNILHEILDRFIKENANPFDKLAYKKLLEIAAQEFSVLSAMPDKEALWLERFKEIARQFIEFEKSQQDFIKKRNSEISGKWNFLINGEQFILRGKADRIDLLRDNSFQILDYKSGSVPAQKLQKDFLAPQLLLEAAMLENGAFKEIKRGKVSALKYIKLSSSPTAFELFDFPVVKNSDLQSMIDEVVIRLSRHVGALLFSDKLAMSARVLPNPSQRFLGDYDHLARTLEWSLMDLEQGEGGEEGQ